MRDRVGLRPGDFVIFVLIVVGACAIWLHYAMMQTDRVYGEIWKDGELYQCVSLAENYQATFVVPGDQEDSTIEVDGMRMRFVQSKCADHTCERTGWVSRVGDTAVCLPNRVLIKIVGETTGDDGGIDVVAR